MRARAVRFVKQERTDPRQAHRYDEVLLWARDSVGMADGANVLISGILGQEGCKVGTIDVYYGQGPEGDLPGGETGARYCIIRSPHQDKQTGGPYVLIVGLEACMGIEPLTPEMARRLYGDNEEFMYRPEAARPMSMQQQAEAQVRGHRRPMA